MKLERIKLRGYRNIGELEYFPHDQVNLIYGDNAQGKTNLIEAIYLFTGQKSFRQSKDSDLVMHGEDYAVLEADFYSQGRSQQAIITLGTKKKATLNELPVTPAELTGRFFAVVFSPAELSLVQDGPVMRRSFIDNAISQVMPRYIKTLASMNRALFQRNSLLGDMKYRSGMDSVLDTWDQSFAKLSCSIITARRRYIARLAPHATELYSGIVQGRETLAVGYQSSLAVDWDSMSTQQCEQAIVEILAASHQEDIRNGYTTLGPQRDDLEITINGASARSFGSQGQQKSCAVALKLAECELIREICGESPLVLLDDLLSELDKSRRDMLLAGIGSGQVFITSCDKTGLARLGSANKLRLINGAAVTPRRKNS